MGGTYLLEKPQAQHRSLLSAQPQSELSLAQADRVGVSLVHQAVPPQSQQHHLEKMGVSHRQEEACLTHTNEHVFVSHITKHTVQVTYT